MKYSCLIRAAVMPAPRQPLEVRSFAPPDPEPGAIMLDTLASEVCGTDVHLWHGRLSGVPYPLVPGHFSVGRIAAVNGLVSDIEGHSIRVGDVVTFLDVWGTCHACWFCLVAKQTTRCPHRRVYGITLGADDGLCGGWSEQIHLKPGTHIVPLRGGVTPDEWIAGGCGLPTALHAIDRAEIQFGDRVLIQGAGPVGLSLCALAQASGAGWVGVVDAAPNRLDTARKMGADETIELSEDVPARVRAATGGRGADIVIEASGHPDAVAQGCALARDGGRYVIVGQYTDNGETTLNPHTDINRKHLEIRGCWGVDLSHVWRAMDALARLRGRFDWTTLISKRYGLDEAGDALAAVESRAVVKALIVP